MNARDLRRPRSLGVHRTSKLDSAANAVLLLCSGKSVVQIRVYDVGESIAEASSQNGDDCGGSPLLASKETSLP